jgi:ferritin-like metal-binding protein YciE
MATQKQQTLSALELFFRRTLQEIYWSELHLRDVLETMEERAGTEELKSAFHTHRMETNDHVTRLEKIFHKKEMGAQPMFCVGMQGLFDEGWQVIDETEAGSAHRDAALIVAAQKVEHYEIATYGSLRTLAKTLGCDEAVGLLEQTLAEEKKTDSMLTELAEKDINADARLESAAEEKSPPPDTGSITTASDPAINAMKEATTGLDAGASSADAREDVQPGTPGSADALLFDDNGQPKGKKRSAARKRIEK